MKINLLLALFTALSLAVSMPSLSAASSIERYPAPVVTTAQSADNRAISSTHFKKEKRTSWLKKWRERKSIKLFQKSRLLQRISLGFVGFLVMLVGGLFIVLGIVIPYVGLLFLIIGIIIAFVGLLLWLVLSRIGVRVSSDGDRRRQSN